MGVAISEPVSVWSLQAPLLEGPLWVDGVLWFVDIKSQKVHRLDPASGDKRSWDAPDQVGFVLPAASGGFVAGLKTGLARFDPAAGSFTLFFDPEPDSPNNRHNDGTVDPAGRLWFGTMDDGESAESGAIYRLGADGSCIVESPRIAITNGPAISPDGRTLYHCDTVRGIIHVCDIGADGALANSREFTRIPNAEGHPDGPTVDSEGCVWVGLYKGSAVRRYSPDGELLEVVQFPVDAITKIAFGGPDLKTVYATTANKHLTRQEKAANPEAGDLFMFEVSVPGQPAYAVTIGI